MGGCHGVSDPTQTASYGSGTFRGMLAAQSLPGRCTHVPKRAQTEDSYDQAEKTALFRYQLIARLLDPQIPEAERKAWRDWVTHHQHAGPDGKLCRVSARTLRRWVALYRLGQFKAIQAPPRRDKGRPRSLPAAVLDKAMALKQTEPRRSVPQVIAILERNGDAPAGTLHRSTLWRQLRYKGLGGRQPLPEKPLRRFEVDAPGRLFQGDVKYGPYLPDPRDPQRQRRTYLVGFLDDHSRLVAHSEFFWAEDIYALELCFQKALLRRGAPAAVYVDQGLIFQSHLFSYACAELGIQHISASPYHAQGKGKIERYWRSLEEAFLLELRHDPVSNLTELNRRLWAWVEEVYHVRIHSETGQTPLQRWVQGTRARPVSPGLLAEVFLWRTRRQADVTAVISFEGNRYQLPPQFANQRVQIRYHPLQLGHLQLWQQGRCVAHAEVLDLRQSTLRQVAENHRLTDPQAERVPYLELLVRRRERREQTALSPLHLAAEEVPRHV